MVHGSVFAVKNFIGLFRDPGLAFSPSRLAYRITGAGSSLRQALLQRRDGRFYLVLWQGVRSSKDVAADRDAGDVEPPRVPVTSTCGEGAFNVCVEEGAQAK